MSNAELNAEIAALVGWRDIRKIISNSPYYEGRPPNDSVYRLVPDYSGDPGAALSLLEYVLSFSAITDCEVSAFRAEFCCVITDTAGDMYHSTADTLCGAIAIACRDALTALQEARGAGVVAGGGAEGAGS